MNIPTLWMPCPACQGRGSAMDLLGSTVTCPVCGGTGRIQRRVKRVHFDYAFPIFAFPTTGGTQQQQLQLDSDAYYELTGWALALANGLTGSGAISSSIQIVDQSTGWAFMNGLVALTNFASGSAPPPSPASYSLMGAVLSSPLITPYVMKPGSQLLATMTVPTGQAANTFIQLAMKGYKIYPDSGKALPEQQVAA